MFLLYEKIDYINRIENTVNFFSIIDLLFSFMFLFYEKVDTYIFFKFLCSFVGYYGSKYYDYNLVFIYWIYLLISSFYEIVILYYFIYLFRKDNINKQLIIISTFIQLLLIYIKCYIIKFVYKFKDLIKKFE